MAKLDALQAYHFTSQKNKALQSRDLGLAQNRFDRSSAQLQHNWSQDDLVKQYARSRAQFARGWNQRGMMNSGMYSRGLGDFRGDYQTQQNRAAAGWRQQSQGFNLVDSQLKNIYNSTVSDLNAQREALLKVKAATLNNQNLI